MTIKDVARIVQFHIEQREPMLLAGQPGIGKTEEIARAAINAGANIIFSHPVTADPTDYKGLPIGDPVNKTAYFVPYNDLQLLIDADKPTVFFLDDVGQAPFSVQAALMQLILGRKINQHKVSEHVVFIAATNRQKDKATVKGFIEPFKSRFSIYQLNASAVDWIAWASHQTDIAVEVVGAVNMFKEWIDEWEGSLKLENTPNPRNLTIVGRMLQNRHPMPYELFKSRLGEPVAKKLDHFIQVYSKLPTIKEIVSNPLGVDVPDSNAHCHALTMMMTREATRKNITSIFKYLERLDPDFAMLFAKIAPKQNPNIVDTEAFWDWAMENTDLLKTV